MAGHFARSCPNAWGIVPATNADLPVEEPSVGDHAVGIPPPADAQSLSASAVADSEDIGLFASQPLLPKPSDSISALSQSILLNIPANSESQHNISLHESGEGNEIHSPKNNVVSCISNESNVIENSSAPSIINNGNGDINNELNNGSSETVFNDGKNNESSAGISKEMNETSTETCIEIVNEMNDSGEITGKPKTNKGSVDLMDLDPNGSSSKQPLDDDSGSLDDDSGLLNDEPTPLRAPCLQAKKKRVPGRAKHSRLPVLMHDRPAKT